MAAEKEMQAHDMVRRRSWARAVALYDQLIAPSPGQGSGGQSAGSRAQKDQQIACLLGRCECLLELGKFEGCLADAYKVLTLLSEQTECLASVSRARRWLVHALFKMHKYGVRIIRSLQELIPALVFKVFHFTAHAYMINQDLSLKCNEPCMRL